MQVPGVLLAACQTMSVKHVGSRRVGALVGAVDAGLLGGGWLRACQRARVAPLPYGRPQVFQISFGHVPLARAIVDSMKEFMPSFSALALRAFSMISVGESKSSVLALPGATHSSRCLTTMPMFST